MILLYIIKYGKNEKRKNNCKSALCNICCASDLLSIQQMHVLSSLKHSSTFSWCSSCLLLPSSLKVHTSAEQEMEVVRFAPPPPPPPPIIFEGQNLPQPTIYHWKGNLSKSPIHFRYRRNILISRLSEQFSGNALRRLQKKFQTFRI